MKSVIQNASRIIIKVGSSLVTNDGRGLDHAAIARWAAADRRLARARQGSRAGQLRRDRRRHAAPRLRQAPHRHPRTAGLRRGRPDGTGADLRVELSRAWPGHRAGAADARRPGRPRALPERALDADHLAAPGRGPDHQRERHGGHRRDQVRRQRHAGRAGGQPDRSRRAGDPDRPARPVFGRSAQGSGGDADRRRHGRRPGARSDGRRRRQQHRAAAAC